MSAMTPIDPSTNASHLIEVTADIVSAYVSKNSVGPADVAKLIAEVHQAVRALGSKPSEAVEEPTPAISIRRSITPDYIVCLEDGKKFKSMKRHLMQFGLTPAQYREKWSLPKDYPMVAPNYAAKRSQLAKSNGLGRKAKAPEPVRGRKAKVRA